MNKWHHRAQQKKRETVDARKDHLMERPPGLRKKKMKLIQMRKSQQKRNAQAVAGRQIKKTALWRDRYEKQAT